MISRREFLAGAACAAVCRADDEPRQIPVALQLFSVRKEAALDLPRVLARVKEIGFTAVEFAGYYGHPAVELHRMLADSGLDCCGAHVGLGDLAPSRFAATVDFTRALGNKRLIVPGLPPEYTQVSEPLREAAAPGWRGAALLFTEISDKLVKEGVALGYHNHSLEFKTVDGYQPLALFLRSTRLPVFLELDLGGAGYGGANPVEVLETYRQRVQMIHVKDFTATKPDLLIGTGSLDWPALFRAAQDSAVAWYVIEHNSVSGPDLADIADSYRRFMDLLKSRS